MQAQAMLTTNVCASHSKCIFYALRRQTKITSVQRAHYSCTYYLSTSIFHQSALGMLVSHWSRLAHRNGEVAFFGPRMIPSQTNKIKQKIEIWHNFKFLPDWKKLAAIKILWFKWKLNNYMAFISLIGFLFLSFFLKSAYLI